MRSIIPLMSARPEIILLPGLDGTGELFEPLLRELAPELVTRVVSYPPDRPLGYRELEPLVLEVLPKEAPYVLVGESFSGPLAVQISAQQPAGLVGLVLVGSFLRTPIGLPRWTASLIPSFLFWFPPPKTVVRRLLVGSDASAELVEDVRSTVRKVSGRVISRRIAEILRVDVTEQFRAVQVPILYLKASEDALVTAEQVALMREQRDDFEVEAIRAPHLILQSAPEEGGRVLSRFIERLEGSSETRRMNR